MSAVRVVVGRAVAVTELLLVPWGSNISPTRAKVVAGAPQLPTLPGSLAIQLLRLNSSLWLSIVTLRLNITYNTTTQYRTVCPPPHLLEIPPNTRPMPR